MVDDIEVKEYDNIFVCRYKGNKLICNKRIQDNTFIYVESGVLKLTLNGKDFEFKAGNCVFVKRTHEVRMAKLPDNGKPFNGIFFILDQHFLEQEYKKYQDIITANKTVESIIQIENNDLMNIFFKTFFNYFDNNIQPSEQIMHAKKLEWLYTLLQIKPSLINILFNFKTDNKINLKEFMENNYNEDLTVEQFAHYTYRSLSTFKREFQDIFKMSPHKWILNKKISEAKKLLDNGKKASEIYLDFGFNSPQHFSSTLKKFGFVN